MNVSDIIDHVDWSDRISFSDSVLVYNLIGSIGLYFATSAAIDKFKLVLLRAGRHGKDLGKSDRRTVPESLGVVVGTTFLIYLFLFIPIAFYPTLSSPSLDDEESKFPYSIYVKFLAALLSICCMLLLGFADDCLDLRWRDKLTLPTVASLPILMVYFVNTGSTSFVVPRPFNQILGFDVANIGVFYYIYMGMLAVFCTNSINILAGINGIEVGQSCVIAISVILFNTIELFGCCSSFHIFSLYFMIPFTSVSLALLKHNWYPAGVFVGDTYCYFAGMTFAAVAILGHFSKTMCLFFLPQIFNFLYSSPQLFRLIPCPRHRLPKYVEQLDKHTVSTFVIDEPKHLPYHTHLLLSLLSKLSLINIIVDENNDSWRINNLTLINFILLKVGPLREDWLCLHLLCLQVAASVFAFVIRYPVAKLFY